MVASRMLLPVVSSFVLDKALYWIKGHGRTRPSSGSREGGADWGRPGPTGALYPT